MFDISIGCDPELFIQNKITKQFVSAHSYFPGTKIEPFGVKSGAVQVDGVAAEFNIVPAKTEEEFLLSIGDVTAAMSLMLASQGDDDLQLVAIPTATFDRAYFDNLPAETKLLGCSPDFNAWTGKTNQPPSTTEPFRTGGGHIHVGWTDDEDTTDPMHIKLCRDVVRTMDASLFVMSHAWDADRKRRRLYGNKGAYRPKSYGVEYRSLSNRFLPNVSVLSWVYNASVHSAELVLSESKFLFQCSQAQRMLNMDLFTETEYLLHNKFLSEWGYESIPDEIITDY